MTSLYKKTIHGKPYWYLREMGWVDGKAKMVSERYVGNAAQIETLLDAREEQVLPERCRNLDFGAVAAVWGLLDDLGVAELIDQACGPRPAGLALSTGTYLALAVLNRVVDPCSKRGFADWWKTTAADRFTKIRAAELDHRRFWDAMHALPLEALAGIEHELALRVCDRFDLDTSSVALDMTNFATFIDTGNAKAPIAQRGKAKQKRADLRLVGLGLVVTRTGGIPLLWHAYPGNKPDVTQFPHMIKTLAARHSALRAAHTATSGEDPDRRHSAALARLPRQQTRRHPVPPHDQNPGGPPLCPEGRTHRHQRRGRRRRHATDDRGLRCRTELCSQPVSYTH